MISEAPYLALLNRVLLEGDERGDRTGTGTKTLFGAQMRFDLSKGFPAVTTKKLFWRGVVVELLWFLSGSVCVEDLRQNGVKFWDAWEREDGTVGEAYGKQFCDIEFFKSVKKRTMDKPMEEVLFEDVSLYYSDIEKKIANIWLNMMRKCYRNDPTTDDHVCERWQQFPNFLKDVRGIPGWNNKLEWWDEYSLDKDILAASNCYHPETTMWASKKELEGNSSLVKAGPGKVLRYRHINQFKNVIASIKHSPYSRRHVISLWNAHDIDYMELPCCHGNMIQFQVSSDGALSCHMYQRSGDMFLGVPVNIASYALLTHIVANLTGLKVGDFVYTLGDAHIYSNHVDQVKQQLSNVPFPSPSLSLSEKALSADWSQFNLEDLSIEDFTLLDYDHHATIKAPIAV